MILVKFKGVLHRLDYLFSMGKPPIPLSLVVVEKWDTRMVMDGKKSFNYVMQSLLAIYCLSNTCQPASDTLAHVPMGQNKPNAAVQDI